MPMETAETLMKRERSACCNGLVRYNEDHNNFYCVECDGGQGNDYYFRNFDKIKPEKYGIICTLVFCPKCQRILNERTLLPSDIKVGDTWTCVHCKVKLTVESVIHDSIDIKVTDES
jgi:hypothetical protein